MEFPEVVAPASQLCYLVCTFFRSIHAPERRYGPISLQSAVGEIRQRLEHHQERSRDDTPIPRWSTAAYHYLKDVPCLLQRLDELEQEVELFAGTPEEEVWRRARSERVRLYRSQKQLRERVEELEKENERLRNIVTDNNG
jgi:hypothetical protein